MIQRRHVMVSAAALALAGTTPLSFAQEPWPNKPVRVIVGYQAGGPTDVVARLIADKLQAALGQPFVVDNRPGAGSNIASEAVAAAAPDGYTLLIAAAPLTMNRYVYRNQKFDADKSFEPVSKISSAPGVLAVSPQSKARNLQELIALAKARPGKLTYGSTGTGGSQHMAGERFQRLAGIDIVHVPYKGGSGALTDLIAGHVDLAFMTSTGAMPFLEAGKVRPIAVAGPKRLPGIPDVPTFAEAGMPKMASDSWNGLLAPAGTPQAIVQRLHAVVAEAVKSPDVRAKLEPQGAILVGNSPAEFRKEIQEEGLHWKEQFATIKIEAQ